MKNRFCNFTCACLLIIVTLSGCHTVKKNTVAYKSTRQPKFISGIYLNEHNKTSITSNAIDARKIPAYTPPRKTERTSFEKSAPIALTGPVAKVFEKKQPAKFDLVSDNLITNKYAEMIGITVKEIVSFDLFRFIDRWYGTNYRLGGDDESGIDCSGFARKLYGDVFGIDLTRTAMEQYKDCKRAKHTDDATEGDLVFFKQKGKRITHVGVYLANDYFIHSSTSQGVIISSLKEDYWHKHYAGIGKIKSAE